MIDAFFLKVQVKLEGDIHQGVAYYKKALLYNWHYADAMYNLGVAYGEMLKFDMVSTHGISISLGMVSVVRMSSRSSSHCFVSPNVGNVIF